MPSEEKMAEEAEEDELTTTAMTNEMGAGAPSRCDIVKIQCLDTHLRGHAFIPCRPAKVHLLLSYLT